MNFPFYPTSAILYLSNLQERSFEMAFELFLSALRVDPLPIQVVRSLPAYFAFAEPF